MIIYKITNIENKKVYVGCDSSTDKHRWYYHRWAYNKPHVADYEKRLYRAFRKYGLQSFEFEILETVINRNALNEREAFWITHFNAANSAYGYNARVTGDSRGYCRNRYRIKNPDGKIFETDNLPDFARENGIPVKSFYSLASSAPTATSCHGWQCVRYGFDFPEIKPRKGIKHAKIRAINSKTKTWVLIDPAEAEIHIEDLKAFCADNNLGYRAMLRVSSGERTHHKGWRVVGSKSIHD